MEHDTIAELLRETPPGLPPGRPDLGEVERRRARRRVLSAAIVAVLVVVATGVPLVVLSSLAGNRATPPVPGQSAPTSPAGSPEPSPAASTQPSPGPTMSPTHIPGGSSITNDGVSIDVPQGWRSSTWPGSGIPVLSMSTNVPLDGRHFPSVGERAKLGQDGVLLMLEEETRVDPCSAYPTPPLPVSIRAEDLRTPDGIELPPGQSWANRAFVVGDRCFYLSAEFGSNPPTQASLDTADAVLASLSASPLAPEPPPSPSPPDGWEDGTAGWIVCTPDGVEVRTPHVIAQADGFHVHVDNLGKADLILFGGPDHPGFDLDAGGRDVVLTYEPQQTSVACAGTVAGDPLHLGDVPDSAYAPISLDDPAGLWHDGSMSCRPTEHLVAMARDDRFPTIEALIDGLGTVIDGLRPGDVITYRGYPEQEGLVTLFVERDGEAIATVMGVVSPTRHSPWLNGEQCAGAGLSAVPRT